MTPLSPTLSKLPLIFCGSPFSSLVTNCSSTVSSIQSLSFTRPPLLSTFLSATEHPTLPRALCAPYCHLLRRQQVETLYPVPRKEQHPIVTEIALVCVAKQDATFVCALQRVVGLLPLANLFPCHELHFDGLVDPVIEVCSHYAPSCMLNIASPEHPTLQGPGLCGRLQTDFREFPF